MKQGATGERKEAAAGPPAERAPRDQRRPDRPRQDKQRQEKQRQEKKKPEPAPFNNPFARAFGKDRK
jgi:hypothetical protein